MGKCFSLTATMNWFFRRTFRRSGLSSTTTELGDGTCMHCWTPKTRDPTKPDVVLIHGVGASAIWEWSGYLALLVPKYNVYVPDLVFFGASYTTRPERSEQFQAQSVAAMMEAYGVTRMSVVGLSYGGIVAYSMAAQFPERVERVVLCCAGVAMEEKDMAEEGLLHVKSADAAVDMLFPKTPQKVKEMLGLVFHKPPKMPPFLAQDLIDSMFEGHYQEKTELIHALHKNRSLSDLPKISQPTTMIWGEYDQIFPIELAHRLKRHLEGNEEVELVIIKDAGHALSVEKPKEMLKHFKVILIDSLPPN